MALTQGINFDSILLLIFLSFLLILLSCGLSNGNMLFTNNPGGRKCVTCKQRNIDFFCLLWKQKDYLS